MLQQEITANGMIHNKGIIKMKITKRQLKRIIREEKEKLISENTSHQLPYRELEELDNFMWRVKKDFEGLLGSMDRKWFDKLEYLDAANAAIDKLRQDLMGGLEKPSKNWKPKGRSWEQE